MKGQVINFLVRIALVIIVLCIPFIIISCSVSIYTHSPAIYIAGFEKYDISSITGFSKNELSQVAEQMVNYYNGKSDSPQLTVNKNGLIQPLYNEKELIHLEDVKKIIELFQILLIASIVVFVILAVCVYFMTGIKPLLKSIQIGAAISGIFTMILVTWAIIDFQSLFILFHLLSFSNNLWILNPATDYLIMMFPEGFFNDIAILLVTTILIVSIIIWLVTLFLGRMTNLQETK